MARYHIESDVTYHQEDVDEEDVARCPVPKQHWIEMPIGNGWVADYQLVFDRHKAESGARIIEVRLRPERPPDYRPPSRDEAVVAKPILPRARFPFDAIRRYVTARQFTT